MPTESLKSLLSTLESTTSRSSKIIYFCVLPQDLALERTLYEYHLCLLHPLFLPHRTHPYVQPTRSEVSKKCVCRVKLITLIYATDNVLNVQPAIGNRSACGQRLRAKAEMQLQVKSHMKIVINKQRQNITSIR